MSRLNAFLACSLIAVAGLTGAPAAADIGTVSSDAPAGRGIIRPSNQAVISSELALPVLEVPRKTGEHFQKGDLLVELDCRQLEAERAAAAAVQREMEATLKSNTYLQQLKAGAKLEVEISRARTDRASAEVRGLETKLSRCKILAPFDGRVEDVGIHAYEMAAPGRPMLSIIDESALEVMLILPSAWLKWIKIGTEFDFVIDETGAHISSKVLRIGAVVDPVSKTVQVFGSLANATGLVLSGMSGSATFAQTNM